MAGVHVHPLEAPIAALASMPAFVESTLARVAPGRWRERPGPEAFSLVEQACHLRDVEREGYLLRVKRMLSEERPRLVGFDGSTAARERDYASQDAKLATRQFAAARAEVVALLSAATPDQLQRAAMFMDERITLADLVHLMVEHDREHRDEMAALADALGE